MDDAERERNEQLLQALQRHNERSSAAKEWTDLLGGIALLIFLAWIIGNAKGWI